VQPVAGRVPATTADEVVTLGDEVAERAASGYRVAERDSAVHAAAGLLGHLARALVGILALIDLVPVTDPLVHRSLGGLDLGYLQKTRWVSHDWPP
jgi:hypothetical protein